MLNLITKAGSGFAIFCLAACILTFGRVRFVECLLVVSIFSLALELHIVLHHLSQ